MTAAWSMVLFRLLGTFVGSLLKTLVSRLLGWKDQVTPMGIIPFGYLCPPDLCFRSTDYGLRLGLGLPLRFASGGTVSLSSLALCVFAPCVPMIISVIDLDRSEPRAYPE